MNQPPPPSPPPPPVQRKRKRQELIDDDEVEVIALSVEEITGETNQFFCELCSKSFNRVQNLQLHMRAHNLPCNLVKNDTKNKDDQKPKVYVCPETTCANHNRCNALGDFTSIRKHYKRKHSEKTLNCPKCLKKYAVEADLRAHLKTCGTKEYKCECGGVFSRRDSYMTHRTLCDALIHQSFSMDDDFSTTGTSLANLLKPNITNAYCLHPTKTPALDIHATTRTNLFPYLYNSIPAPPCSSLQSSASFSNPYDHRKISATDPGNYRNGAQGSEFSSDGDLNVDVLYNRLFAVSSAPTTAFPQEVPQQGYSTLANHGNSASCTRSMKNTTVLVAADLEKSNFSSATSGNSFLPVFQSNFSNNVSENDGPSDTGGGQFNQEQLRGSNNRVGGNADFPELQNDFCWGYCGKPLKTKYMDEWK